MDEVAARGRELQTLAESLGLAFGDLELLDRALTHASIGSEQEGPEYDYESLEFLGDAALGLAVAERLFRQVPDRTPGDYSRMRASIVNRRALARVARRIGIADAIRLGKGEELSGGRKRASLLADCLEALIGALYLDQGWETAREFVVRVFAPELETSHPQQLRWDYKSRLQQYCQAAHMGLPAFEVVRSEGPDHRKEFEIEVRLDGKPQGRGLGRSKKEAEQRAAKAALEEAGVLEEG
jgi:ribonuclease-3